MRLILILLAVLALLALGLVPFFPQIIYPIFMMKLMCFALFACAFNLLLGFGGILSFGHAAFFASAAYATGYTMKFLGWSTEAGLLAGVLASAILGALFGALASRRSGIYLAMITLALSQLVYFAFLRMPWTGAENGLRLIPRGKLFGLVDMSSDIATYFMVLTLTLGGLWLIWRTVHSPFGHALRAIRDHEARAVSLGFNATAIKVQAFALSAGLAGLAGSMKALVFGLASLGDAHWTKSGDVVLMALVGGSGTILGPVLGAALMNTLQYYLDAFGAWVGVITGLVFICNILLFKKGILGTLAKFTKHLHP